MGSGSSSWDMQRLSYLHQPESAIILICTQAPNAQFKVLSRYSACSGGKNQPAGCSVPESDVPVNATWTLPNALALSPSISARIARVRPAPCCRAFRRHCLAFWMAFSGEMSDSAIRPSSSYSTSSSQSSIIQGVAHPGCQSSFLLRPPLWHE